MRIEIKSVDPVAIRYATCGDWIWLPDGSLQVSVPDYGGQDDSAFLVALHEMVEAWQCRKAGIREADVTAFDIAHPELEEPGDSTDAPYYDQHSVAAAVEMRVCSALGMDWEKHNDWVGKSADEVERNLSLDRPRITLEGSRYWAELHLFALRHCSKNSHVWFQGWLAALPFDGCPCEKHLKEYLVENPPEWERFFDWTVELHNAVNVRIGRATIDVENARELWSSRSF